MIDPALHTRLAPFTDGRRVRHSFAARTGPPISVGVALVLAALPVGYWLRSVSTTWAGVIAATVLVGAGVSVLRMIRAHVIVALDGEFVVLRSRMSLPSHPVRVVKRVRASETELVVRTSPWGFAQAHLDGEAFEVVARDYTNAHAMGQMYATDSSPRFAMG